MEFFSQYGLIILLVVLLGFMFWSSRRRMAKQKADQAAKATQTIPGAEVLLQGGLYGTIVEFDPENLDRPAIVEIAPGVDIKVHSQAIIRVVEPSDAIEDDVLFSDAPAIESIDDLEADEDGRFPANESSSDPDSGKPQV